MMSTVGTVVVQYAGASLANRDGRIAGYSATVLKLTGLRARRIVHKHSPPLHALFLFIPSARSVWGAAAFLVSRQREPV